MTKLNEPSNEFRFPAESFKGVFAGERRIAMGLHTKVTGRWEPA
jgi:hypothetical protein